MMLSVMDAQEIRQLYQRLIEAWNKRDASAFSECFADDSICIGFDGSEMAGKATILKQLSQIFNDHKTATYVTIVRDVKMLTDDVFLLHAQVGMIQPGKSTIEPSMNAIQLMVAADHQGVAKISSFQNTPAQYHGRPEMQKQLTEELQKVADENRLSS
ncbi:SgcJ/EcaC family oxidoreductase [Chryseolinea sp. T2]|uniref:SgcJ/EcaC family oxidoreductase n=1 Tax=Chryseolinea sp. T2 TaxID=3129255 RepID=UPI0030779490